jgi:hypothetical protein
MVARVLSIAFAQGPQAAAANRQRRHSWGPRAAAGIDQMGPISTLDGWIRATSESDIAQSRPLSLSAVIFFETLIGNPKTGAGR